MTPDGVLVGPYRRLERLGEGAMGEVHRAVDTLLEREVALKTLRPDMGAREDLVERFRVEAIALARLHHRHIATIYAFFRDGGQHHIAMQYLRGRTLDAVLRERGRLPWREAAAVAMDVLLALEHAHTLGVIHRDLKPANLMIDHEQRTVVMDFGIARVLVKDRQTRAGTLVGTLEYIAPEIVRGEDADARSDLYALGCVLYEMVTGELPFQGASDFALMRAHAEQAPPPPRERARELPAALEAIILRALAKRPGERFADAAGFRAALQAALGAAQDVKRPGALDWLELPRSADRGAWALWLRANPGLAGVALVAAGGLATALAWGALQWRPPVVPAAAPPALVRVAPATPTMHAPAERLHEAPQRPAVPVFEMPPPPQPRVSVERTERGDRVERARAPAPPASATRPVATPATRPSPPREPAPAAADAGHGGWYVKH